MLQKIVLITASLLTLQVISTAFAPPARPIPKYLHVVDCYMKAHKLYTQKKYDRSTVLLKKALTMDEDYWPAFYLLGHIYYRTQDYGKALEAYTSCMESDPPDVIFQHCEVAIGHTRIMLYHKHIAVNS